MAQMVERVLGKDEVTGSIPVSSSKALDLPRFRAFFSPFAEMILISRKTFLNDTVRASRIVPQQTEVQ